MKEAPIEGGGIAVVGGVVEKLNTGFIPAGQAWLRVAKDY